MPNAPRPPRQASEPDNPASNNYYDVVLYDKAFDTKLNLTHVLDHELAHRVFDDLSNDERESFRRAAGWQENPERKGSFRAGRSPGEFLRSNDSLSPEEDFADSITAYIHEPEKLKAIAPSVYNWIRKQMGTRLESRSSK